MANTSSEELEGTTLEVYLYIVKKGGPAGPRDIMKSIKLSSPSVAYRHLQKLEELGYLAKNEYGEYQLIKKATIKGKMWLGKILVPKMRIYALVFLAILMIEIIVCVIHFSVETYEFKVFFGLLMCITGLSFAVFITEDILQARHKKL